MRDRDVSSFDLDYAKSLSRVLGSKGGSDSPSNRESTDTYVRFPTMPPSTDIQAASPASRSEPKVTATQDMKLPRDIATWEDLLAWLMRKFETETTFIVDNQGFVIANSGPMPPGGLDGIGAEVYLAFEQLERVDTHAGRLLWIDLEFARRRIVALGIRTAAQESLLFVWINISSDYVPHRPAIESAILEGLSRL